MPGTALTFASIDLNDTDRAHEVLDQPEGKLLQRPQLSPYKVLKKLLN